MEPHFGRVRIVVAALLALLGWPAPPAAAEPDGAVAPPWRWSDPRGTVSGSRRSTAHPITGPLAEAWTLEPDAGPVIAPPVTWDGRLYLLTGEPGDAELLAVDLETGRVLGDRAVSHLPEGTTLQVWDDTVYVAAGDKVQAYEFTGRGFRLGWAWRPGEPVHEVVVFEGEVYVLYGDGRDHLAKLYAGRREPEWDRRPVDGVFCGRPAIYGDFVYELEVRLASDTRTWCLYLDPIRRESGAGQGSPRLAWFAGENAPPAAGAGEITVGPETLVASAPARLAATGGSCRQLIVACRSPATAPAVLDAQLGLFELATSPAVSTRGMLAIILDSPPYWAVSTAEGGLQLANATAQPDLFRCRVAPTVLGDVVYFGTWAADLATQRILWRLPQEVVRYPLVPADGLVIAVDGDGRVHAMRARENGR